MTSYEAVRPLEPGKPVDVIERDESGAMVGAWIGYWNFRRNTVALYPNVKNRYVNWPGGRLPSQKVVISDRMVKIKSQSEEATVRNSKGKMQNAESGSKRKSPLEGQEIIKL